MRKDSDTSERGSASKLPIPSFTAASQALPSSASSRLRLATEVASSGAGEPSTPSNTSASRLRVPGKSKAAECVERVYEENAPRGVSRPS